MQCTASITRCFLQWVCFKKVQMIRTLGHGGSDLLSVTAAHCVSCTAPCWRSELFCVGVRNGSSVRLRKTFCEI